MDPLSEFVSLKYCLENVNIADIELQKGELNNPDSITFLFADGNAFELIGLSDKKLQIVDLNEVFCDG